MEDLLTYQGPSPAVLKVKRSLLPGTARSGRLTARPSSASLQQDYEEEEEEEEERVGAEEDNDDAWRNGAAAGSSRSRSGPSRSAALRSDATATASTSGHHHLRPARGTGAGTTSLDGGPKRGNSGDWWQPQAAAATTTITSRPPFPPHQTSSQTRSLSQDLQQQQQQQRRPAGDSAAQQSESLSLSGGGGAAKRARGTAHPLPPDVTQERDRDIHSELRGCEDWRDVLDIVTDEAEALSLRTAVQALTRLNTLSKGTGPGAAEARREMTQSPEFGRLAVLLHSQAPAMNNVQLSNTLYALAQLQARPSEEVLEVYFAACRKQVANFYPRDIATLFAAAATMGASPPRELLDEMGFRATGFLTTGTFDARSIPMLLHACPLLGYKNPILAQATAQQLGAPGVMASLAPQGVANSLWALARMATYHPPAVEMALAAFTAGPMSYKPQECANLLWALTAFRHHPGPAFAVFARSLLSRMDQLRPADLATLLYSLATFNVSPGEQVLGRLATCITAMIAESAPSSSSSSSSEGTPGTSAAAFQAPSSSRPSAAVNAVELCNMYWGLALLGEVEGPLFAALESRLTAEWERAGAQMPESLMRMVFQGFLASRLANTPQPRPAGLPSLMLDACKRAWTAGLVGPNAAVRRGRASLEHVGQILKKLRVVHDVRRPTGDGLALIDLAVKAGTDTYVALQVIDDKDQCANDSKQLLGPVILERQLLEKNGWEVRYLNTRDLDRLAPELQPLFVADLLKRLGVKARTGAGVGAAAGGAAGRQQAGTRGVGAGTRGVGAGTALPPAAANAAEAEAEEAAEAVLRAEPRGGGGGNRPVRKLRARR